MTTSPPPRPPAPGPSYLPASASATIPPARIPVARNLQDHVEDIYRVKEESFTFGVMARYQLGESIGEGGFSRVYRAHYAGSSMVMKIPKSVDLRGNSTIALTQSDVDNYRKEALIWAKLTAEIPDSVINLIDAGVEPFPWLVMELADGNLRTRYPHIAMAARLRILCDLLNKLQTIHDLEVVHRDIKPDNVLVVAGVWKFTDFGLSKVVNNSSRSSHIMSGTYSYMAPEQMDNKKWGEIDIQTDIWQFGVMATEVLSGHLPFEGDSPHVILSKITMVDPDLHGISPKIVAVLEKALRKEKDQRWASAKEFSDALKAAGDPSGLAQ
jgi:serine/threonine protein kinase